MAVGDGGEPVAGLKFQSVWFSYFACYPYRHPLGNHMVRDIELYGVRSPVNVPAPEGSKEGSSGLGVGNLFPVKIDIIDFQLLEW